jgi:tRNA(fMet)-specific endonuclease VapC
VRVAVDTNRYGDFWEGVVKTVSLLEEAESIVMPFVVIAELRAGFVCGKRQAEHERKLSEFLTSLLSLKYVAQISRGPDCRRGL